MTSPQPGRLADRLDIIDVCTRWHWYVDHREWDAIAGLLDAEVSFPTPSESASPDFRPENYLRRREEIIAAYPALLAGLVTQHLIAGHQVSLDGDRAVCLAHSVNVHVPEHDAEGIVVHGNDYRFELRRAFDGWRVTGRQTSIRWRYGDEAHYAVDARMGAWSERIRPQFPAISRNQHEG